MSILDTKIKTRTLLLSLWITVVVLTLMGCAGGPSPDSKGIIPDIWRAIASNNDDKVDSRQSIQNQDAFQEEPSTLKGVIRDTKTGHEIPVTLQPSRHSLPREITVRDSRTGEVGTLQITPLNTYMNDRQPIIVQLPSGVTIRLTYLDDEKFPSSGNTVPASWQKLSKGITKEDIKALIGMPGETDIVPAADVEIWIYRYENGQRKHIAFQRGRVIDWK